jgi:hypothetical protein
MISAKIPLRARIVDILLARSIITFVFIATWSLEEKRCVKSGEKNQLSHES